MLKAKVVILGDPGVGKTSLIMNFVTKTFPTDYKPTLGADFLYKNITEEEDLAFKDNNLELVIWDIAGQTTEEIDDIINIYLEGANGAIIVFDITNKKSFENLNSWHDRILKICGKIPYIIVGNKIDLEQHRSVSIEEIEAYKNGKKCDVFDSSAKTGENVSNLFVSMAKILCGFD